jgi:hypothetical protein
MMKKFTITIIACLLSICTYSQVHIKFNGATFGKPVTEFIKGFPGSPSLSSGYHKAPKGFNPDLCNRDFCYIRLNSQDWSCHIFSSRSTKTVFRTVSVGYFDNLETQSMLLVKTLEEKYGGGVQETQGNLGEVVGYSDYYKEMLALYYYIKDSNGRRIGEIRISVAPKDRNAMKGYIELSYTDYSAQKLATREYNSLMRNAL